MTEDGDAATTGRPPRAVDRAGVLAVATRYYVAGRPIDMSTLAADLGLSRATLYRRVGKHEELLGAVLAEQTELTFRSVTAVPGARAARGARGVDAVCAVLGGVIGAVLGSAPLRSLIDRDPVLFVRVVIGPGAVEDRSSELVEQVIVTHLGDELRVSPRLLARTIVRMSDGTMYTHLLSRRPAEVDDLLRLIRVVLEAAVG